MQAAGFGLALIGAACGCLLLAACLSIAGVPASRLGPARANVRLPALRWSPMLLGPVAGGMLATAAGCIILLSSGTASPTGLFTILLDFRAQAAVTPLAALFWLLVGVPLLAMGLARAGDQPPMPIEARRWEEVGPTRDSGLPAAGFALPAAFLALVGVADGLSLVLLWQAAATVLSILLVDASAVPRNASRGERRRLVLRATIWPAALQASGACLLAAMLLFDSGCGSLRFADLQACGPQLEATRQSLIFILTVLACGSAVLVPLLCIPADTGTLVVSTPGRLLPLIMAPRLALYPLLLIPFTLLGPGPAWWGVLLIAIGAIGAPIGTLRCIAARSAWGLVRDGGIAQAGVVMLCLGSALVLRHSGSAEGMALEAALLGMVTGTAASTLLVLAAWTPWDATERPGVTGAIGSVPGDAWARVSFLIGAAGIVLFPVLGSAGGGWLAMQALLGVASGPAQGPLVGGLAACGAVAMGLSAAMGIAALALVLGRVLVAPPPSNQPRRIAGQPPVLSRVALCLAGLPVLAVALAPQSVTALLRPTVQDLGGGRDLIGTGAGPLDALEALAMHAHFSALSLVACLAGYTAACALGAQVLGRRSRPVAGAQPTGAADSIAAMPRMAMPAPSGSGDDAILTSLILHRLQAYFGWIATAARRRSPPAGGALGRRVAVLRERGRGAMPIAMVRLGSALGGTASLLSLVALFVALAVLAR